MSDKIAVVFGASGFVGRHVVRELAAQGWRVRAAVRRPVEAEYLRPLGVVGQIDITQCNIRYRGSVEEAMIGADAVVNLVGLMDQGGAQKFSAVHVTGAQFIAEAATKAGIDNIVHISAIGARADSESLYAQTKAQGEDAFRKLAPSTTILRPSIMFGPQDQFFNRFAAMARMAPILPLIGGGKTKFQPIYVDDVADCIVKALSDPQYTGKIYELGGPDVASFKELMEMMLRVIGRHRILAPIPFFMAGTMGGIADVVAKLPFIQAPITADQVRLLKYDNVVGISGEDNIGSIADFGLTPETMATILPTYLVRFRTKGQFSPETA